MQTLEKPPPTPPSGCEGGGSLQSSTFAIGGGVTGQLPFKNTGVYSSPPKSADYYSGNKNKGSSFSFIKNNWRLPRSNSTVTSSMSQPQDLSANNPVSPPPPVSRPLAPSSTPGSFQVSKTSFIDLFNINTFKPIKWGFIVHLIGFLIIKYLYNNVFCVTEVIGGIATASKVVCSCAVYAFPKVFSEIFSWALFLVFAGNEVCLVPSPRCY